jgi:hypothetical protein
MLHLSAYSINTTFRKTWPNRSELETDISTRHGDVMSKHFRRVRKIAKSGY